MKEVNAQAAAEEEEIRIEEEKLREIQRVPEEERRLFEEQIERKKEQQQNFIEKLRAKQKQSSLNVATAVAKTPNTPPFLREPEASSQPTNLHETSNNPSYQTSDTSAENRSETRNSIEESHSKVSIAEMSPVAAIKELAQSLVTTVKLQNGQP